MSAAVHRQLKPEYTTLRYSNGKLVHRPGGTYRSTATKQQFPSCCMAATATGLRVSGVYITSSGGRAAAALRLRARHCAPCR